MQVKVFPLDMWGCGHYRMFWPTEAVAELEGHAFDAVACVAPSERKVAIQFDAFRNVKSEQFPVEAGDVIVFQRPTSVFLPQVVERLQARGVTVVIDMDDDLSSVHTQNPAWLYYHPKTSNGHSWLAAVESCKLADMVTVTTPQLARRYAKHGRVRILPNMVPGDYLEISHPDSSDIGWAGSVQSHPSDLQQVGGSVARIVDETGAVFRSVGDIRAVREALGLKKNPLSVGDVPIAAYAASVAQFGIGIAPLLLDRFNHAKSRLKPLEYAAVGVPWIGSPTEDYELLHGMGCGVLAAKPKDWLRELRSLVTDEARRRELSEAGRAVAATQTFERNAWRWAEAWHDAARK